MAIRIITDSTSDIPLQDQKKLGIDIVSLSVIFDGKKYTDGVDLKKEQFYEMLRHSTTLPSTSQVNPDGFFDFFKNYTEAGDDVLVILISSKLSGTYQSAVIAKEMVGSEHIHIVDSKNATFGLALLVYEAIKLRNSGADVTAICDELTALRERVKFYAGVNTLKYLKMGGRLSSSAAIVGGVLHIKPLVSVIDGEVKNIGRVRGQKAVFEWIRDKMKSEPPDMNYPVVFGHSDAPALMREFIDFISADIKVGPYHTCEIGCVIGTHGGPGCVGLAYIAR